MGGAVKSYAARAIIATEGSNRNRDTGRTVEGTEHGIGVALEEGWDDLLVVGVSRHYNPDYPEDEEPKLMRRDYYNLAYPRKRS